MSERGSFTTQYIYNIEDYKTVRKALDGDDRFLCVSPPATWSNGEMTFEMPIVSGKVGEMAEGMEWTTIEEALRGVKTNEKVSIVIICDSGSIFLLAKKPNGNIRIKYLGDIDDA